MTILYYSVVKETHSGKVLKTEYVGRSYSKAEGVKNIWEMRNKDRDTYIKIIESTTEPNVDIEI